MTQPTLILASTSPYRAALLERLGIPFQQSAPDIDETPHAGESPTDMVTRLGREKAEAVRMHKAAGTIIAGDQTAEFEGRVLGKPGSAHQARQQLAAVSGKEVRFLTSITLLTDDNRAHSALDETRVRFRKLKDSDIDNYLHAEPALDCAGSFKSEGLGISLCESIQGNDPTALVGLPLISLCRLLRHAGYQIP